MNDWSERTDIELKNKVVTELQSEWNINIRNMTISVEDENVTLDGFVSNYIEKLEALRAVKRVVGIKAITDNLKIQQAYCNYYLTDRELAAICTHQVDWATFSSSGTLLTIRKGWLDLQAKWRGVKKASQSTSYGTYEVSERYLICSR
jgi:BON domain